MRPAVRNHGPFAVPGLSFYFGWRAHHDRAGRDLEAGRQQGTGGNKRAFPDLASIQQNRSDSNEAFVFDRAAVNDYIVAYQYAVPDVDREVDAGWMKNAVILNICRRPYLYVVNVTANHCIKPDAAVLPYYDISYNAGARGYENIFCNPGQNASISDHIHVITPVSAFPFEVV
jgi:hypothetical protein